jgi:hypothetical protein
MPTISEAEKQERRRIAGSVAGTQAMEGIQLSPESRQLLDRYAEGELTLDEFSANMDRCAEQLLAKRRELAGAA